MGVLLLVGTLFLAAGFFVIALMVEHTVRWSHLTFVALGTAAATLLVNTLFGKGAAGVVTFAGAVLVALVQTFLAMGIGGGLAPPQYPIPQQAPARYPYTVLQNLQKWGQQAPGFSRGMNGPRTLDYFLHL